MRQHSSSLGFKQKWVNYHTGVKGIFFRLSADARGASVAITLEQADPGIRALFFSQWEELRHYLETTSGAEWTWEAEHWLDDGRCISRIHRHLAGPSLHDRQHWADLFVFLENGILSLDSVWADCNEVFKDLAE